MLLFSYLQEVGWYLQHLQILEYKIMHKFLSSCTAIGFFGKYLCHLYMLIRVQDHV